MKFIYMQRGQVAGPPATLLIHPYVAASAEDLIEPFVYPILRWRLDKIPRVLLDPVEVLVQVELVSAYPFSALDELPAEEEDGK
jgi:hypothetical protein